MAAKRPYKGRLAFDPDTELHVDPAGKPVVTDDDGKTWRYATSADTSHNSRYGRRPVAIDGTANRLGELMLEHGREEGERKMLAEQPHHFAVTADDPHYDGVRHDPDHIAEKITGHTEAYQ